MENEWEEVKGNQGLWIPEEVGETVEGTINEIKQGPYGAQAVIETEDGKIISTPSHAVLQSRLIALKVGDTVKIEYTGEDLPKIKGNNPTKMYKVFSKPIKVENI